MGREKATKCWIYLDRDAAASSVGYGHGITRIGTVWYGMVWYVTVLSPNPSWISADSTEVEENRRNSRKLRSNGIFSMCAHNCDDE